MQIGDAVYCPDTQQVYAIVGVDENGSLQLKNLTNPSFSITTMRRIQVMDYPTNWNNHEWYSKAAKTMAEKFAH